MSAPKNEGGTVLLLLAAAAIIGLAASHPTEFAQLLSLIGDGK